MNFLKLKKRSPSDPVPLFKNVPGLFLPVFLIIFMWQVFAWGSAGVQAKNSTPIHLQEIEKLISRKAYGEADTLLHKIIKADSQYQEASGKSAWFLLGLIREKEGDPKKAIQFWLQGMETLKNKPLSDLYLKYHLARVFAESDIRKALKQITRLFYEVLETVDPAIQPDLWKLIWDECKILLSENELMQVKTRVANGEAHPGHLLKIAFKREDPSPMSIGNEYVYKFFQRAAIARKQFSDNLNPRGYDDRGDIYVLLGQPSRRFFRRSGVRGAVGYALYPYEIWFYNYIHPDLYFTFIGKIGKDYYTLVDGPESIFGLFYRGHRTFFNRLRDAQTAVYLRTELYMTIAPLHRSFQERLERMEQEPTLFDELEYALQYFPDEDREHARMAKELVANLVLGANFERQTLTVEYNWAGFKKGNKTHMEFYYLIPYEDMLFTFKPFYQTMVRSEIGVFDSEYNLVFGDSARIVVVPPEEAKTEGMGFISQFGFDLDPGNYIVMLKVNNFAGHKQKEQILTAHVRTEPYLKDSLYVSDIELAQDVYESHQKSLFQKKGLFVLPLPTNKQDLSLPMFIYFEIYNLSLDSEGKTRYQMECRLVRWVSKKGLFNRIVGIVKARKKRKVEKAIRLVKRGESPFQQEYFQLDVSKMPHGEYTIELIVEDLNTKRVVQKEKKIELIEY